MSLNSYPDYARLFSFSPALPSKTTSRGLQFFAEGLRLVLGLTALAVLPGCSIVSPLNEDVDMQATGSIAAPARKKPALPAALDEEDRRRAMGALSIALDPQGNGATVRWDNPVSKSHGLVTPLGYAYPDRDLICRKFSAIFDTMAGAETDKGAACRDKDADWSLAEIHKAE